MTRERALILIGALVIIAPFSGFPHSYLSWALPLLGGLTIGVAVSLRKHSHARTPEVA